MRQQPEAFVADDCNRRQMFREHTSGTTGKPLNLWWSRETLQTWYALAEARWRSWYGVSRQDRWAMLGGQLVTPVAAKAPPFWVWNAPLRQLYMSSYHLAPEMIPAYLEALVSYRIHFLFGYTSSIYTLAREALRLGRHDVRMAVVITNAEPVFDHQRADDQRRVRLSGARNLRDGGDRRRPQRVRTRPACICGRRSAWSNSSTRAARPRPVNPATSSPPAC